MTSSVSLAKMKPALELANISNDSGSESSSEDEHANVPLTPPSSRKQQNRCSSVTRDIGYAGSPAWLQSPNFNFDSPPPALPQLHDFVPTPPPIPPMGTRMLSKSCPDRLDELDFDMMNYLVPNRRRIGTHTVGYRDVATQTDDGEVSHRQQPERFPAAVAAVGCAPNPVAVPAEAPPVQPDIGDGIRPIGRECQCRCRRLPLPDVVQQDSSENIAYFGRRLLIVSDNFENWVISTRNEPMDSLWFRIWRYITSQLGTRRWTRRMRSFSTSD